MLGSTPEETELAKVGWATCQEAAAGRAGEALPAPETVGGGQESIDGQYGYTV